MKIGSLESEKIIIGSLELEKIGSVESEKSGPYRSILSYLAFSKEPATVYTFWLNCIVTITQAYWDVSEADAAFKTIQKTFSKLCNLKSNLLNVGNVLRLAKQTQVHAEKNALGRHGSDTKLREET